MTGRRGKAGAEQDSGRAVAPGAPPHLCRQHVDWQAIPCAPHRGALCPTLPPLSLVTCQFKNCIVLMVLALLCSKAQPAWAYVRPKQHDARHGEGLCTGVQLGCTWLL